MTLFVRIRSDVARASRTTTLFAAAFALSACSSETVAQPPPAPVDWHSFQVQVRPDAGAGATASERAVAQGYTQALSSAGFAGLAKLFDDDARFTFPGTDDAHGQDPIVRAHGKLLGAFDQRVVTATRVWHTATEQTVEWSLAGVFARDWMGLKATQKPVAIRGVALIWTKDDGSITDLHLYFDVGAVKAALAAPAGGAAAGGGPSASGTAPQVYEQASTPTEAAGVAAVRAHLDALENGNLNGYLDVLAEDVEVRSVDTSEPARGKVAAAATFKALRKAIGQLDTTVSDAWGVGSFVVVEYTIEGEQLGAIGNVPAQRDRAIRLHLVDIAEVGAGKITRVWRFENPSEILASAL